MILIKENSCLVPRCVTFGAEWTTPDAYCGEWEVEVDRGRIVAAVVLYPEKPLLDHLQNISNVSITGGSVIISFDGKPHADCASGPFLPVYLLATGEHGNVIYLSGGEDYAFEFGFKPGVKWERIAGGP